MKTSNSISPELEAELKKSDPEIQAFVDALQLELTKLHKKNIQLEANNVSLDARINALEEEMNEYNPFEKMSKEARTELIKELEERLKDKKRISTLSIEELEQLSNIAKNKSAK